MKSISANPDHPWFNEFHQTSSSLDRDAGFAKNLVQHVTFLIYSMCNKHTNIRQTASCLTAQSSTLSGPCSYFFLQFFVIVFCTTCILQTPSCGIIQIGPDGNYFSHQPSFMTNNRYRNFTDMGLSEHRKAVFGLKTGSGIPTEC